jgi:hypothetical protein
MFALGENFMKIDENFRAIVKQTTFIINPKVLVSLGSLHATVRLTQNPNPPITPLKEKN